MIENKINNEDIELWTKKDDVKVRNFLIEKYAHLVKYTVGKLKVLYGDNVEFDDMLSEGIIGLIDAIKKYDYKTNVPFSSYAILRIRGSIIDFIRNKDFGSRVLRKKEKISKDAKKDFLFNNNRECTIDELSKITNMSIENINETLKYVDICSVQSLNQLIDASGEKEIVGIQCSKIGLPETELNKSETKRMLIDSLTSLTEKEKTVILLYYYEDLTAKEISNILNVTESRISQIHSSAIKK